MRDHLAFGALLSHHEHRLDSVMGELEERMVALGKELDARYAGFQKKVDAKVAGLKGEIDAMLSGAASPRRQAEALCVLKDYGVSVAGGEASK